MISKDLLLTFLYVQASTVEDEETLNFVKMNISEGLLNAHLLEMVKVLALNLAHAIPEIPDEASQVEKINLVVNFLRENYDNEK